MVIMHITFLITDRKAGDPSQAGADQTDGKLRDSKERCVAKQRIQAKADCSVLSPGFLYLSQ